MRRFLQFLFTVAMGAALLYLFAGKHNLGKVKSNKTVNEPAHESAKGFADEPANGNAPPQPTVAARPQPDSVPEGGASENPIDSIADGQTDSSEVRSTESILSVIRKQTPTLKFVYNQALRSRPGMKGKLVLKMRIAPSGRLADVTLVSSTTKDEAFDNAVTAKVETWRFQSISSGKDDIVTVPFTFSE